MPRRIEVNGTEITNPVAKFLIGLIVVLIALVLVAALIFLVLPVVGIAVSFSVGIVILVLVALILALPMFIIGGTFIALILTPLYLIQGSKKKKKIK